VWEEGKKGGGRESIKVVLRRANPKGPSHFITQRGGRGFHFDPEGGKKMIEDDQ